VGAHLKGSSHNGAKGTEPMKKMSPQIGNPGDNPPGVVNLVGKGDVVVNQQSPKGRSQDSYNRFIGKKPSIKKI